MTEEVHSSSRKRKRIVSDEEVVKDNKMNCELLHCGYMNTISNRDCGRGLYSLVVSKLSNDWAFNVYSANVLTPHNY